MADETHYHKLERMYCNAPINEIYQPKITISHKRTEIEISVHEKLFHAAHALHGSVYFKMLDDAAFFAANSVVNDVFVLTTDFNIRLLRPVSEGIIRAVGTLTFSSKVYFVSEAKLYNDTGKEVAIGSGSFLKSKIPLTEEIGYR